MAIVDRPPATRQVLEQLLAQRILVLDGAMGTMVHALKFSEADFRGREFADHSKDLRNLIDVLSITQPEAIENIHRSYLEAGADIIETNTFGATSVALADFALEDHVREINLAAVALARRAADDDTARKPEKPRFVAGSIGPTNKQLSIAGNVEDPGYRGATFDQMVDTYYEQVDALVEGGVDILLAETAFDTLVLKACLFAIEKYFDDHDVRVPVMASFTVFEGGRTLSAQTVEACWNSICARRPAERRHQLRPGPRASCGRTSKSCRTSRRSTSVAIRTPACPTRLAASTKRRNRWPDCWASSPATAG